MGKQKAEVGFLFHCLECDKFLKITGNVDFDIVCPLCDGELEQLLPGDVPEDEVEFVTINI